MDLIKSKIRVKFQALLGEGTLGPLTELGSFGEEVSVELLPKGL